MGTPHFISKFKFLYYKQSIGKVSQKYQCRFYFSGMTLSFLAGPPPKNFANLSEQELNQLVEQRHSALGEGPKKTTNWFVSTLQG